jgi:hypothetical protein
MTRRRNWDFRNSSGDDNTPPRGLPDGSGPPGSVPPPGAPLPTAPLGDPQPTFATGVARPVPSPTEPPPFSEAESQQPPRGRSRSRLLDRKPLILVLVVVLVGLIGFGGYWFQPWRLVTDRTVQDTVPEVSADDGDRDQGGEAGNSRPREPNGAGSGEDEPDSSASPDPSASAEPDDEAEGGTEPGDSGDGSEPRRPNGGTQDDDDEGTGNSLLAEGDLISHEHDTSGTVQVVELGDGRRQLVIKDLDTSDGPDLYVRLSDQPVEMGRDGWRVFDDGEFVDVAPLKGNRGDQVYTLGSGVDLEELTSVSIWCRRFSISFGAAELERA